jgi:Predicted DNA-binding protein with an HTH domain
LITIRLPVRVEKRLVALAKKAGRTKIAIACEAILEYIEDLEDCHAAERCIRRIHLGKEKTYTLEEVENHLGLKD